jgi:hypothetical protein
VDEYWFWRPLGCCSVTEDGGLIHGRIGCGIVYTRMRRVSLRMINQKLGGSKSGVSNVVN